MAGPANPTGSRTPRRSAADTREHILEVAADLFYWEGVHATGVDTVAARAAVAPTTLYRLFRSKDDLVAAYVERCSVAYKDRLETASAPAGGPPRERILAVFDVFADEALSESYRGCPFQMVLAEFPDPTHPAHEQAVAHKSWIRGLLRDLVRDLGTEVSLRDPDLVAEQLALVAEGIYASVQSLGAPGSAQYGRALATTILDIAAAERP